MSVPSLSLILSQTALLSQEGLALQAIRATFEKEPAGSMTLDQWELHVMTVGVLDVYAAST
jgi:hypothetical protein